MLTAGTVDNNLTPLTEEEEEFFSRIRSRLVAYFRDFEEAEGFSALNPSLDRLLRKVSLELRCVCYEHHDSFLLIEALRAENESLREERHKLEILFDQVIVEVERAACRLNAMKTDHERVISDLHTFYSTQESLRRKQLEIGAETQRQQEIGALLEKQEAQLKMLKLEHKRQLELIKEKIDAKTSAELEYTKAQLRLQITSQVSREIGRKLARQEKLCEKHKHEIKQLNCRIAALQSNIKQKAKHDAKDIHYVIKQ